MRNPGIFLFLFLLLLLPLFLLIPNAEPTTTQPQSGGDPVVVDDPDSGGDPIVVQDPTAAVDQTQAVIPRNEIYIVQAGDTLESVAELYGISTSHLLFLNSDLPDGAALQPGQQLTVPAIRGGGIEEVQAYMTITPSAGTPGTLVTVNGYDFPPNTIVQVGPSLYGSDVFYLDSFATDIAGSFATYVTIPPDVAQVGENWVVVALISEINFSIQSPLFTISQPASASSTHVVQSGDSMYKIANMYGITLEQLLALNPQIQNPRLIYPGDVVNLF